MTTADGTVVGTATVVDNGPASERWNVVMLGDGYRAAELDQYRADVRRVVDALLRTAPFDELATAINVHRVDVASTDSGADDPTACGGTGATARTYFDATFCVNGIRRLLVAHDGTALTVASAQVPQWHTILMLVNSTVYGGSGGAIGVFSLAPGAEEIALHELGHTAFGLADEYEYYQGCGVDTDRDRHPPGEPFEPNVTTDTNRATLKWRGLVAATTPLPTTRNADCTSCDPQPDPFGAGTVGAYEGAHYYHCAAYRPQFDCRMRALGSPFCAVCRQQIRRTLTPYLPRQGGWRWCRKCQALAYGLGAAGACPAGGAHDHTGSGGYTLPKNVTHPIVQASWRWCRKCQGLAFAGGGPGRCPAGGAHDHTGSSDYTLPRDIPITGQSGWRWCRRCQGLAYAGGAAPGACPAGGSHDHTGSAGYHLPRAAFPTGQSDWRWCRKCEGLAYAGAAAGRCPAGGAHDHTGSSDYRLPRNVAAPRSQTNWRWCRKCQVLAYAGGGAGRCAAGGTHDHTGSATYTVVRALRIRQDGWRWCRKCQGMVFAGTGPGRCAAGGGHDWSGSAAYSQLLDA